MRAVHRRVHDRSLGFSGAVAARVSGWEVLSDFESLRSRLRGVLVRGSSVRPASRCPASVEPEIVRRRTARRVPRLGGLEK